MKISSRKINKIIEKNYPDRIYMYEEFRECKYPGIREKYYAIGEYGTVFSIDKLQIVKPFRDTRPGKGYYRINLAGTKIGTRLKVSVHRLVAYEFCDNHSEKNNIVNHMNALTFDNYYKNLEWCDISHNTKHAFNNGHYYDVRRKFSKDELKYICELYESGKTPAEVCKLLFSVDNTKRVINHYNTLFDIFKRKSYREVSKDYNF